MLVIQRRRMESDLKTETALFPTLTHPECRVFFSVETGNGAASNKIRSGCRFPAGICTDARFDARLPGRTGRAGTSSGIDPAVTHGNASLDAPQHRRKVPSINQLPLIT